MRHMNRLFQNSVKSGKKCAVAIAGLMAGMAFGQVCDVSSTAPNAVERPLYVIVGQSNAAGLASVDDSADPAVPDLANANTVYNNVQIYGIYGAPSGVINRDSGAGSLGVNWSSYASWGLARPGYGYKNIDDYRASNPGTAGGTEDIARKLFGPELYMAHFLNNVPGPQFIVKLGVAGTSLIPQSGIDNWAPAQHLYTELLSMIANAYNTKKSTYRLRVAGIFFMQGESDARNPSLAPAELETQYKAALGTFIASLRNDIYYRSCADSPNIPFVIGRIQNNAAWTKNAAIRKAQQYVDKMSPSVGLANTDDFLAPNPKGMKADGVHFNEYGQAHLGARAFHALVAPYGAGDFQIPIQGNNGTTLQNFYTNGGAYCCYDKNTSTALQNYLPVGFVYNGVCGGYSCSSGY
jgi:hypothetical protein